MPVRVLLFGAPRVDRDGEAVTPPRARGRALLAYLAHSRQPHTREALAALLWPGYPPDDAFNNLRRELSLVRSAIGGDLIASDRRVVAVAADALAGGRLWLDTAAFDDLVAAAESHRHPAGELCDDCAAWLAEAEALYTADFLAGFGLPDAPAFDHWQGFAAERLRAVVDAVRGRLAAHYLAAGEAGLALDLAQRRLAADPLNEPAHRDRLRALALAGRAAAALSEHEAFARRLAEEIGQTPEPETLELLQLVARDGFPRAAQETRDTIPRYNLRDGIPRGAQETWVTIPRYNLRDGIPRGAQETRDTIPRYKSQDTIPHHATPFLGREAELAVLSDLFADPNTRLVTLVAPGGMGKTRLAVAWAGQQQAGHPPANGRFADGVFFVDLAPVADSGGFLPALAEALRFPLQSGGAERRPPLRQITDFLAPKRLLLLVDNAEHLPDITPTLLDVLAAAPRVALLVTSRERLNVRAEQVVPIDGLALDTAGATDDPAAYPAGRLFVGAARRIRADFAAETPAERQAVARICRLTGGMPLALEMAAAWADVLSLNEIAAELERGLDLLESNMQDVPLRQRSVRAAIDSTWQRLDEPERLVFAQLAVFRGGLTREAAAAVAEASPRTLAALARKSLIRPDADGRIRLHELLRQYAAERLAADPALAEAAAERHAAFFAGLLAAAEPPLIAADETEALARLDADSENLDVAMGRLLAHRAAGPLLSILNACCLLCDAHLRARDGYNRCEQIIAAFDPPAGDDARLLLARAMNWRVYFHLKVSDERDSVPTALARARALLAELDGRGLPLGDDLALNHYLAGDPGLDMDYTDERVASFETAYRLYTQSGNTWGIVNALHRLFMGYTYGTHAHPAASRALAEHALEFAATLDNRRLRAPLVSELMQYAVAFGQRDLVHRLAVVMERDLAAAPGESPLEARDRGNYAWPLLLLGRVDDALLCYRRALDARLAYALPFLMRDAHFYGRLLLHAGHYDEAATQFQRGRLLARAHGSHFVEWLVHVLDAMRLLAQGQPAAAEQLLRDALALDLSLLGEGDMAGHWANLGLALARQGRVDEAWPVLARSLRLAVGVYNYLPLIEGLPAIALLLAGGDAAQQERAAELYGLLLGQPFYAQARVHQDASGAPLAAALSALPPDVAAAAIARGRELPLWATAEAMLEETTDFTD